jgi:hypothetical protein
VNPRDLNKGQSMPFAEDQLTMFGVDHWMTSCEGLSKRFCLDLLNMLAWYLLMSEFSSPD